MPRMLWKNDGASERNSEVQKIGTESQDEFSSGHVPCLWDIQSEMCNRNLGGGETTKVWIYRSMSHLYKDAN